MNKNVSIKIDLENQLEATINELEEKLKSSGDNLVAEYLNKYTSALSSLKSEDNVQMSESTRGELRRLLNGARGYLEVSSDYQQKFLIEMGKTEKLIKSI